MFNKGYLICALVSSLITFLCLQSFNANTKFGFSSNMMQLVEDEPRLDPGVIDPQNLPLCQELGDEIEGTWKGQVWMPKNCKFKMYTKDEAKKCFKGKSIAIIGDSTSLGIWRESKYLFGDGVTYSEKFDYEEAVRMRKEGDPRVVEFTTRFIANDNIIIRFYSMWSASMWSSKGYPGARDNKNQTIPDVLRNQTIDLVILNIGAHSQLLPISDQMKYYINFLTTVSKFYQENWSSEPSERKIVPLLWNTMNPNYPSKKPADKRFQTTNLSTMYNNLAYYFFGPEKVPIINFESMMIQGFPKTSRDGMHSEAFVDIMKNQMIVNYVCNGGEFNTEFKLGKFYTAKVDGRDHSQDKTT